MKLIIAIISLIFSLTTFAAWNEVECAGTLENKSIHLEIERSFPNDAYFRRAELTISEDGTEETHIYHVSRHIFGINRVQYSTAGLRLEVDLWPDNRPQWGKTYQGQLLTSLLGTRSIRRIRCRFPNAY